MMKYMLSNRFRRIYFRVLSVVTAVFFAFCLVAGVIVKPVNVKADPVTDALLWAAFEASTTAGATYMGTAGQAALIGKMAHDRYGVTFPDKASAQNFVTSYVNWCLRGGGFSLNSTGQLITSSGALVFITGYKAATAFSIVANKDVDRSLSQFVGLAKSGYLDKSYDVSSLWSASGSIPIGSVSDGSQGNATGITLDANARFQVVSLSGSSTGHDETTDIKYGVPGSLVYVNVESNDGKHTMYWPNGLLNFQIWKGGNDYSYKAKPFVSTSTLAFDVGSPGGRVYVSFGNAGDISQMDVNYSITFKKVGDTYYPDYTGVTTSGTDTGTTANTADTTAGAIPADSNIGLATNTGEDSIPIGTAITGATDTTAVNTGTLEGVTDGTITGAQDGTISPPTDWTAPNNTLDFTPLMDAVTDRFPFCIPWDLVNSIKTLVADSAEPTATIVFPSGMLAGHSDVAYTMKPFTQYPALARGVTVFRWFMCLAWLWFLMLKTRSLVGGT